MWWEANLSKGLLWDCRGWGGYPFGKERGINKNRGKDRSQKNSGEKEQQRQVVYNFINKANSSFEIAF